MWTLFMLFLWTLINNVECSDLMSTVVFIPTAANNISIIATGRKHDLRYGFHKVAACASFEQSFICIQKCVDLNYDVAHADKDCKCTCFIKKDKEKYKSVSAATRTRWRSGAPKTSIPPWAGGQPVMTDPVPEINILDSSEEALKGDITNSTNVEETLKDQDTGGDDSNSTAAADSGATIASGDTSNNVANDVTSDTSSSPASVEEAATAAPPDE